MTDKLDYDLTCWYLNLRRVAELVGNLAIGHYLGPNKSISDVGEMYAKLTILSAGKDAIVEWLRVNKPPTLGQLIMSDSVSPGRVFTHYSNFFCKGLTNHHEAKSPKAESLHLPEIYSKLDDLLLNSRLSIRYYPEHLTSESAWSILSGQRQLFVLAAIDNKENGVITAIPYAVATLLPELGKGSIKGMRWNTRLEVFIDSIDSFVLARNEPIPSRKDLNLLKDIPEIDVKRAFAEIIGEPTIPKDWGGEKSDLFSTYVTLDGTRISTAFAFKGPAQFKPMTFAECGKNGDQIDRLFSEPADLLVLQHCHEITVSVRGAMRAYATGMGDPRLFALINGYDTIRLLRAYRKCGFEPTLPIVNPS